MNVKKPFKFHQSTYRKVSTSFRTQSSFTKRWYSFAEEFLLIPLVILGNLCDEACFYVKSKTNIFTFCHNIVAKKRPFYFWFFGESQCLKLVSSIFSQIFISHQMITLQKLWKWFLLHLKSSFRSRDIQNFFFHPPLFFSLSATALEVVWK